MTTDTSTGAAVRLHPADEEETELQARVTEEDEIRAQVTEEGGETGLGFEDALGDVYADESEAFDSLDDLMGLEDAERKGRWVKWEILPDAEVFLAHMAVAQKRRSELELELREKKGWTFQKYPSGKLPGNAEEYLWRDALYKTAVKGWRGESFKGRAFTEKRYRELMYGSRRFRNFVYENIGDLDDLKKKAEDDSAGN